MDAADHPPRGGQYQAQAGPPAPAQPGPAQAPPAQPAPAQPGPARAGPPGQSLAGPPLTEEMLASDPVTQFTGWLAEAVAAGLPEPNAMVVSTVSAAGQPHSRSVLLKSHGADGFTFYTNRTSRKGQDLAASPWASLLFPWYALRRQVCVDGPVVALTQDESEPYFHSRPHHSQIGAWASRQSTVIPGRSVLEERFAKLAQRWPEGTVVPMPGFWGGYRVIPETVEFWQGRANRLHDRLRYRRSGDGWVVERLAP